MDDIRIRMIQLGHKGYTCSQILLKLALENRSEENPALIRAMAGLAYGGGDGRGNCGALTGGLCLLALYAGKGSDGENASDLLPSMLADLSEWFSEQAGGRYGGMDCRIITGEDGPAAARMRCGGIVAETYEKALAILAAHGVDPSGE